MLLSGHGSVGDQFDIKALPNERRVALVSAHPEASATRDFQLVRIGFDKDGELASMFLADKLNQITQLTFTHPIRNAEVRPRFVLLLAAAGGRCDRARSAVTAVGDGTYRPLADRLRPQTPR